MTLPPWREPDRDWGAEMQKAAEKHMSACWEAEEEERSDSPAVGPFDGCDTCVIRETLHAVWPLVEEYADHVLRLTEARREAGLPDTPFDMPTLDEGDPWTSPITPPPSARSTDVSPAP